MEIYIVNFTWCGFKKAITLFWIETPNFSKALFTIAYFDGEWCVELFWYRVL
jgi:hypothetical protein